MAVVAASAAATAAAAEQQQQQQQISSGRCIDWLLLATLGAVSHACLRTFCLAGCAFDGGVLALAPPPLLAGHPAALGCQLSVGIVQGRPLAHIMYMLCHWHVSLTCSMLCF